MSPKPLVPSPSPGPPRRPSDPAWELSLAGELTDKGELIRQFVECPYRSSGTLWIDSCGGSVYVGLALASVIRLRGLQVTGIVIGECSSAALMPFAACTRRFVTPHSTLLFHPMRWQSEEQVQLEEAAEWARHFKKLEQDLDELIAQLFSIDRNVLTSWTHPGKFVSGPELVEAGLATMVNLFDGPLRNQISVST